jgi:AcrR family transcriptional regulator
MELFWERGYEGVTLDNLLQAMGGISPPSFYNAFKSKEALFREAVDLFVATVGAPGARALAEAPTARDGVEAALQHAALAFTQPGKPHGCLLIGGATNCSQENNGAQAYVQGLRRQTSRNIRARLARAIDAGEISPDADIDGITASYVTVLNGIGVRAADGASRQELLAAAAGAMAAWPSLVGLSRKSSHKAFSRPSRPRQR